MDLAARIGAGVLNTLTNAPLEPDLPGAGSGWGGLVSQNSSRGASESDYRSNAAGLAAVADRAADLGVAISIELHQNTICDNSWSLIHLLELVDRPNVGANPDLGNVYWTYETPGGELRGGDPGPRLACQLLAHEEPAAGAAARDAARRVPCAARFRTARSTTGSR